MPNPEQETQFEGIPPGEEYFPRGDVAWIITQLEKRGYIAPVTRSDQEGWDTLVEWGRRGQVSVGEVSSFLQRRLTERGREFFDPENPSTFLEKLHSLVPPPVSRAESPGRGASDERARAGGEKDEAIPPIDRKLRKALESGPSSLIDEEVIKRLAGITGKTPAGRVPLKAWLLNPRAVAEVLRAIAGEATADAGLRKAISETTRWLAGVAGDDAKRDALLSYIESLEEALADYVPTFCEERKIPVPQKGTLARMALLLRINAEMRALQARAHKITEKGEELIEKQVNIQAKRAENQMLAKEMPSTIEADRQANVLKEREITEKARHLASNFAAVVSGAITGAIGGLYAGLESSVSTLVERHPKVAISLGAGVGFFVLQLVSYSGPLSGEILRAIALKSGLAAGVAAVGTGIGAGLVARLSKKEEEQVSQVSSQEEFQ